MFDHLLVGEAQDGDALTAEEGVAESITSLSRGVGRAVHLDGQFGFDAKEVGEVVADGELSTELEAELYDLFDVAGDGGATAASTARDQRVRRCRTGGTQSYVRPDVRADGPAFIPPERLLKATLLIQPTS